MANFSSCLADLANQTPILFHAPHFPFPPLSFSARGVRLSTSGALVIAGARLGQVEFHMSPSPPFFFFHANPSAIIRFASGLAEHGRLHPIFFVFFSSPFPPPSLPLTPVHHGGRGRLGGAIRALQPRPLLSSIPHT